MTELITKRLLPICVLVAASFSSLYAHSEAVDNALAKVTIVVDGMQKSKSGAT